MALGLLGACAGAAADSPLFEPIASVLQHPRCLNCHTVTDYPRQGDARVRHLQSVIRGADGHGAPTLQCAACHQTANTGDGFVPGAGDWHLAPLSMGWEGLSAAEICAAIQDPTRNGGRTLDQVLQHMETSPLVLWAWSPGTGRDPPPVAQDVFVQDLQAWAAAGAPC